MEVHYAGPLSLVAAIPQVARMLGLTEREDVHQCLVVHKLIKSEFKPAMLEVCIGDTVSGSSQDQRASSVNKFAVGAFFDVAGMC